MKLISWTSLFCAGTLVIAAPLVNAQPPAPQSLYASPVTTPIVTQKLDWFDAKRQRAMPVTLHYPQNGQGPFPLLIISHGLGGTRDSLEYVGNFWASHGYVCAQIQHVGSDDSVWRGARPLQAMQAMKAAAMSPANINNRPADVKFAIDTMLQLNADPKSALFGRIDTKKIGVAGHSFGAFTAQAVAGRSAAQVPQWHDPRVVASIALSAPSKSLAQSRQQYSEFKTPFYLLTGTEDNSPIGDTTAADRRVPFDAITGTEGYLLTIDGADHMTFGGRSREGHPNDALDQTLICASTLAFWDAYLKDSGAAKTYLRQGSFAKQLAAHGTFEVK